MLAVVVIVLFWGCLCRDKQEPTNLNDTWESKSLQWLLDRIDKICISTSLSHTSDLKLSDLQFFKKVKRALKSKYKRTFHEHALILNELLMLKVKAHPAVLGSNRSLLLVRLYALEQGHLSHNCHDSQSTHTHSSLWSISSDMEDHESPNYQINISKKLVILQDSVAQRFVNITNS